MKNNANHWKGVAGFYLLILISSFLIWLRFSYLNEAKEKDTKIVSNETFFE